MDTIRQETVTNFYVARRGGDFRFAFRIRREFVPIARTPVLAACAAGFRYEHAKP